MAYARSGRVTSIAYISFPSKVWYWVISCDVSVPGSGSWWPGVSGVSTGLSRSY